MRIKQLVCLASFLFCAITANAESINVAVAANVQFAFNDLAKEFQKETGIEAKGSVGASGKFATQIENGAPFDVFLSADMEFPQKLYTQKLTTASPKPYVYGTLVLWTTRGADLKNWQKALLSGNVKKIAVANPKTAPYGRETMRLFDHYKMTSTITPKLVYGDSITQTSQYIVSGVVDAGFTAKSVVIAKEMKDKGQWIEMPKDAYQPIAQGVVIIKASKQQVAAQKFVDFVFSPKAKIIFERYGYALP